MRMQQFRFGQQRGAAAMAIHQRRRAAEIQVDAKRVEAGQVGGIGGQQRRVVAQQLDAHRGAGLGARTLFEFGRQPRVAACGSTVLVTRTNSVTHQS
jgi:hypothetical protein